MTDAQLATLSKSWAQQFAARLTLARHIVDELAQEAALGILRARQLYKPSLGEFTRYARTWAYALMRHHLNKMGGPVGRSAALPDAVSLVAPEADPSTGYRDQRETRALQHETAEFREALSRTDDRTAAMVLRRMEGDTFEQIGNEHGVSRQRAEILVKRFAEGLT